MPAPVFQQVVTGSALGPAAADVTSAILAAGVNHLYLAFVFTDAAGGAPAVSSVTGLGLTWTLVGAQCSGQDEHRVEAWRAIGSPSAGSVTATFAAGADGACIAVERWSGVGTTAPVGASVGYNTNGASGACSGGTDNKDATGAITTTAAESVVSVGYAHDEMFSHAAGWTGRVTNESSGASLSASVEDKAPAAIGSVTVGAANNLAAIDDWVFVAVEILAIPPSPALAASTIRSYDGIGASPIGEITGFTEVEIAFDEFGPAEATVNLPRASGHLAAGQLFPGGIGAYYEIDAREMGVPEVWLGRVVTPQAGSQRATCTLRCEGPKAWLDQETVGGYWRVAGAAADIMRAAIQSHPTPLRIKVGRFARGTAAEVQAGGQTVWGLAEGLAKDRGESFGLSAIPGSVVLIMDWYTAPDRRVLDIELREGVNCEWDLAYNLNPPFADLIALGDSFGQSRGITKAATVQAPSVPALGRRGALAAVLAAPITAVVRGVAGGVMAVRPDLLNRAALEAAALATLRRNLTPTLAATVEITDRSLWGIKPGDVVPTRWPSEPTGVWASAYALVRTTSYQLAPTPAMRLSVELWATR